MSGKLDLKYTDFGTKEISKSQERGSSRRRKKRGLYRSSRGTETTGRKYANSSKKEPSSKYTMSFTTDSIPIFCQADGVSSKV